jgi:Mannosylglycerate hydrolase MGH1-like glycoside hydrolase domain
MPKPKLIAEASRLSEARQGKAAWKKWGPYLSERQWGTVREDYSESGDAWDYFTHDQARSRAYHWGEDGLGGISDEKQRLCFALALWNGTDPILKERLFGLSNSEANHGEDVKEYYYYLDSTPTHSYMKYLYKYPQAAYPYEDLVNTNRKRTREEFEYELMDTGVFDQDRYFDVFVEYAKAGPEDLLIQITVHNRGPEAATLHVLPTLWFRNTWSFWPDDGKPKPSLRQIDPGRGMSVAKATHPDLGEHFLYCEGNPALLFTENETNNQRLFGTPNASPLVKDGIHEAVIHERVEAVNPEKTGTKLAAHYILQIKPGESQLIHLRLSDSAADKGKPPFGKGFDQVLATRLQEADQFYDFITPDSLDDDQQRVMRQALSGMLWSKQHYHFDLDYWLQEHDAHPLITPMGRTMRNINWFHMVNDDIISMPDKWEYPWYAAWDLAFHTVVLTMVDPDFAKQQLNLMLRELYLHPSGQIPAYEWNFSDVNPPVHAWATYYVYLMEKELYGEGDIPWLKSAFNKLLMNFTWWVNRKDPSGRNVFEGGFLGLDNIGIFDRSSPLPTGGHLEQADGTAWMAMYCQNMLDIAIELAQSDRTYDDMAIKFLEHFLLIAATMDRIGEQKDEMWDEEDGFFYDLLRLPDGSGSRLKVRSMVGLLPLAATAVLPPGILTDRPGLVERIKHRFEQFPELTVNIHPPAQPGVEGRHMLAVVNETKLRRILHRVLDENEFLSPYGIRALSRYHEANPYVLTVHGQEFRVSYLPAESNTGMFGGNSNWRGPVWMPVNFLLLRALLQFYSYYGDEFKIECPTGSGVEMTLFEVTRELATRLTRIFLRDENGRRPVFGSTEKLQTDPHWKDYLLFYEYFHGDNGAGLGASHQTGWTGLVGRLLQTLGFLRPEDLLKGQMQRFYYDK